MTTTELRRTIDVVWRIESARLIAGLARTVRDVGLAEELAQDALVSALAQWPESGVPDNPGAWLMVTAKHRAIDLLRRMQRFDRKLEEFGHEVALHGETVEPGADAALSGDDDIGDDLLRLVFIACHPVLSTEARVASGPAAALELTAGRPATPGAGERGAHAARAAEYTSISCSCPARPVRDTAKYPMNGL